MEKIYALFSCSRREDRQGPNGIETFEAVLSDLVIRHKGQPIKVTELFADGMEVVEEFRQESLWLTREEADKQWEEEHRAISI